MHLSRLAACTVTTAVLTVASGAGSASAATGDVLYQATSGTGVVQVSLKLPTALPGVPNPAVLTLLGTQAEAAHGKTGNDVAAAQSFLAGGSLVSGTSVLSPLNRVVTASLAQPGDHAATLLTVPSNPLGLDLDVSAQHAAVNTLSRLTTSSGSLADGRLGSLRDLGLGTTLDTALSTLTAAVAQLVAQSSTITSALNGVPSLPSISLPNPLSGVVPGSPATISTPTVSGADLAGTVTQLPAQVQAVLAKLLDGAVLSLKAVGTSQRIVPGPSSVVSSGATDALDLSLFGGLVDVQATKATVSATAARTASAAKADASATLLSVKVATGLTDLVTLVASDEGITAGILDGTLLGNTLDPTLQSVLQQVDAALNDVLSQLTALLESLNSGAKLIQQGTVTKQVSADGHRVEAHAVPAQVTLGLPVAGDLLTVSVGKADAVSALSVAQPVTVPQDGLPKTGGSPLASLLAVTLLALAGGAVVLRRRQLG